MHARIPNKTVPGRSAEPIGRRMNHRDHHDRPHVQSFKLVFFLNLGFTVFEFIGGLLTNSVAIMADAVHDLGDSFALGSAWYLERVSRRIGDERYTYGYQRFSLLGALITAAVLIVGSLFLLSEVIPRLMHPEAPNAKGMLFFAVFGVAVNGVGALRMGKARGLSARIVTWHLLEDVLGWAAVLAVGLVLLIKDIYILDPILSCLITAYVLANVLKNLRKAAAVFLQRVPEDLDLRQIEKAIRAMHPVIGTHHMHAWSLDGERHVLSTHVVVDTDAARDDVAGLRQRIRDLLKESNIEHSTVEIEYEDEPCADRETPARD